MKHRIEREALSLWQRVAEPRVQRVTYLVIYLFHVVAGVAILFLEPHSIAASLGTAATITWGAVLAGGGLLGAIAVLPGWNYVERIAILAVMVGIALASLLAIASPWSPPGLGVVVWSFVTGWLAVFGYRAWEIRLYAVAPAP